MIDRDVHEDIEWVRRPVLRDLEVGKLLGQRTVEVLRAIVVMPLISLHAVPLSIARRPNNVVHSRRSILDQSQNGLSASAVQFVALGQRDLDQHRSSVHHGQIVIGIGWVERPKVDDLFAVGVCDFDALARLDQHGLGLARGNRDAHLVLLFALY